MRSVPRSASTTYDDVSTEFRDLLAELERFWKPLPDKPEETAEGVLRALWSTACGVPASIQRAARGLLPALDRERYARLRQLIERKRAGVPLAHLTERQSFLGLELLAGPQALIPRRETEILARAALARIVCLARERDGARVLDICTGSGNLALAYAWYEPRATVHASDISGEALELAGRNAEFLGIGGRVDFRRGDLLEPFEAGEFLGGCDLVSCNPPYISSAKVKAMHPEISSFEPQAAFDGGAYGLSLLTRLVRGAPRLLRRGGWLAFEVGQGQGPAIVRQLGKNPAYDAVESASDAAGEIRAVLAKSA